MRTRFMKTSLRRHYPDQVKGLERARSFSAGPIPSTPCLLLLLAAELFPLRPLLYSSARDLSTNLEKKGGEMLVKQKREVV